LVAPCSCASERVLPARTTSKQLTATTRVAFRFITVSPRLCLATDSGRGPSA